MSIGFKGKGLPQYDQNNILKNHNTNAEGGGGDYHPLENLFWYYKDMHM